MNSLWLIPALIFLAVLFAVHAFYRLMAQGRQSKAAVQRRIAQSRRSARDAQGMDALRAGHGWAELRHPLLRRANDFLVQTGLEIEPNLITFAVAALALVLFPAWALVLGYGAAALLLAAATALAIAALFLRAARQRRLARFAELLPDAIDVIIRAVRVGYPLPVALDLVAREMPDPVGPEFGKTADEITFGQDVRTALENLYRRVGQDDLLYLILAFKVQSQTGGNLAEILARLSRLMRNRTKLQLKIRALSADGRISALVLSLMPFVLFGGICLISPSYFGEIRHHPLVGPALIYGAVSLVIGNIIMYRMVNFKY
jgi:tight adherence protein B